MISNYSNNGPEVIKVTGDLTSVHGIYVDLQLIWSGEETFNGGEVKDVSKQL